MRRPHLLFLAASITISGFLFSNSASAQAQSNEDYCLDTGHVRLFLADITTEYDDTDKASLIGMIDKVLSAAKGGDRVVIRTITNSFATSEKLISRCIPQCPARGLLGRLFKCSDGLIRSDTDVVRSEILEVLRGRLANFQGIKIFPISYEL